MKYTRARRLAALALTAVVVAGLLAACGSSSSTSSSSSAAAAAGASGSGTGSGTAGRAGFAANRAKLAACLKQHGVTLPSRPVGAGGAPPGSGSGSPPSGGSGSGSGGGGGGGGQGGYGGGRGFFGGGGGGAAANPKFRAAFQACGGKAFGGRTNGFHISQAAITKFAACVKQHGYTLPKPNLSGKGAVFPSNIEKNAKFQAASKACRADLMPAGGARPPGNSSSSTSS